MGLVKEVKIKWQSHTGIMRSLMNRHADHMGKIWDEHAIKLMGRVNLQGTGIALYV